MKQRFPHLLVLLTSLSLAALAGCDDDAPTGDVTDARVGGAGGAGGGGAGGGAGGGVAGEVTLTVTEPEPNAVVNTLQVRVAGTVTNTSSVTVNGAAAAVSGGDWEISVNLPGVGPHDLVIAAGDQMETRTVVVDQTPPRLTFRAPMRAAHIEADTVDLAMTATDGETRLGSLTVDGIELDPANGPDFALNAQGLEPGVNLFRAVATDAGGNAIGEHVSVLHGALQDPEPTVGGALRFQLGPAAIDALEQVAVRLIGEQDLAALLPNPLLEVPARISVTDANWDELTVDLVPVAGQLDLTVQMQGVNITVEIGVGQNPALPAVVGVDRINLTGALVPRIVDGRLTAEIPQDQLQVEVLGLMLALDQIDDFGDDPGDANLIEEVIGAALTFAISDRIPGALEGLLGALDEPFEFEVLGATLALELLPEVLVVNERGLGVRIGVDVNLVGDPNPPSELPGYLSTPSAWNGVPETDQLGVAVDDDLLNAVLFQLWRSGVLLPVLDSAFIQAGGPELAIVSNLLQTMAQDAEPGFDRSTPLAAVTRLPLPIAVRVRKGADDRIGLELGIAGLELNLRTDDAAMRTILDGSATLLVSADLGVNVGENNALGLALEIPEGGFVTAFDVVTEGLRGEREAAVETRTETLLGAIGSFLPGLLEGLELPTIDLVDFGEITVGSAPQDPNFLILDVAVE